MTYTVKLLGYDDLIARLTRAESVEMVLIEMVRALEQMKQRLAKYPPQVSKPQPFKTARSRAWFFANLRAGRITVPRPRTNTLGSSWQPPLS